MDTRTSFRMFIRHMLGTMVEDGKINLTNEEIEKFANGIEDDMTFYDLLGSFLEEYINDYGENYGI